MGPHELFADIEATSDGVFNRLLLENASGEFMSKVTLTARSETELTKMVGG